MIDGIPWPRWMAVSWSALISVLTAIAVAQSFTTYHLVLGLIVIATASVDPFGVHLPWQLCEVVLLTASFLLVGQNNASFALFAILIIHGAVPVTGKLWESVVVLAGVEAVLLSHVISAHRYYRQGWITWMAANVLIWAASRGINRQTQLMTELQEAQAALAEQAVVQERQRIAREIHDVIAHSLTVTMLHLTGARLALQHDTAEAAEALLEAERLGRQSLADIRRTVGLLTPADGVDGTASPLPGAGEIRGLVAQYRGAGLDVRAKVSGDPASVSLATGLGLYRMVQEALANVAKHDPRSRTLVTIDVGPAAVRLKVRSRRAGTAQSVPQAIIADDGAPSGLGIKGMIERAALLGGRLTAGPNGDGWVVEAAVPLEPVAGVGPRDVPGPTAGVG
jgi:signal transduction histidine kinase